MASDLKLVGFESTISKLADDWESVRFQAR
jgi:hypothetical protein